MLLSVLAFLVYLEKRSRIALIVSAIAAGSAWLTKSPGLFLIPFMVLLIVLYSLRRNKGNDKSGWRELIFSDLKVLVVWGGIAALVFVLFWPAMWVNPIRSLTNVLMAALGYAEEGHEVAVFFNGKIYANGRIPDISFYLISFMWRTTPVTLLGLIATPVLLLRKKPVSHSESGPWSESNAASQRWGIEMLLLFAFGFAAFMTIGLKKFDRYVVPSFVALDLVAGVSLVWLIKWTAQLLHDKWRTVFIWIALFGFVIVQAILAWSASPYYFSYYNPLLGGSRAAIKTMQIGWGEGLDQAARYLNQKPHSNRLSVMSWYGDGSFFFLSKSRVNTINSEWSSSDWDTFNKSDYIVIYITQWQRNIPADVLDKLKALKPEYSVWINGLEYVQVYKIQ
jgi:hypothetical protein